MVEKGDPAFAAFEPGGLGYEEGAFFSAFQNPSQDGFLLAGGDHHRNTRAHDDSGGLDFGRHAAHSGDAIRSARHFFKVRINLFNC